MCSREGLTLPTSCQLSVFHFRSTNVLHSVITMGDQICPFIFAIQGWLFFCQKQTSSKLNAQSAVEREGGRMRRRRVGSEVCKWKVYFHSSISALILLSLMLVFISKIQRRKKCLCSDRVVVQLCGLMSSIESWPRWNKWLLDQVSKDLSTPQNRHIFPLFKSKIRQTREKHTVIQVTLGETDFC